jgi:hypothetical protein
VSWASADLAVYAGSQSRHWNDTIDPNSGLPGRDNFTGFTFTGVHVGPAAPSGVAPTISMTGPTGKVNTGAHGGKAQNCLLTVNLTNTPSPTTLTGTLTYGDGDSRALIFPLPDSENHAYILGPTETSHVYNYSATATNGITPDGAASGSFTLVESPAIAVFAEGTQYYDGNEVLMYPYDVMSISLAPSTGYIESWSIVNTVTGLNLTGEGSLTPQNIAVTLLYGDTTFTVANTGSGLNFDRLTLRMTPEPATLALLVMGGLALLRRRK